MIRFVQDGEVIGILDQRSDRTGSCKKVYFDEQAYVTYVQPVATKGNNRNRRFSVKGLLIMQQIENLALPVSRKH